jgi:hypothetical protein
MSLRLAWDAQVSTGTEILNTNCSWDAASIIISLYSETYFCHYYLARRGSLVHIQ